MANVTNNPTRLAARLSGKANPLVGLVFNALQVVAATSGGHSVTVGYKLGKVYVGQGQAPSFNPWPYVQALPCLALASFSTRRNRLTVTVPPFSLASKQAQAQASALNATLAAQANTSTVASQLAKAQANVAKYTAMLAAQTGASPQAPSPSKPNKPSTSKPNKPQA